MSRRRNLKREGDRWNTSAKPTGTAEIPEMHTRQFTDDARFFDVQGGNTDGVAITAVDRGGTP